MCALGIIHLTSCMHTYVSDLSRQLAFAPIRKSDSAKQEIQLLIRLHMVLFLFCFCLQAGKWILCNSNWTNCRLSVVNVAPWSATILKISVAMMLRLQVHAVVNSMRNSKLYWTQTMQRSDSDNSMAYKCILRSFSGQVCRKYVHPASQSHQNFNQSTAAAAAAATAAHVCAANASIYADYFQPRICNS